MRYETVQTLKEEDFKRCTGVSRAMFEKMLTVVQKGMRDFGRTPKLNRANTRSVVGALEKRDIPNPLGDKLSGGLPGSFALRV